VAVSDSSTRPTRSSRWIPNGYKRGLERLLGPRSRWEGVARSILPSTAPFFQQLPCLFSFYIVGGLGKAAPAIIFSPGGLLRAGELDCDWRSLLFGWLRINRRLRERFCRVSGALLFLAAFRRK